MNHSPHLDSEEACIQEAIGQFYSFFGRMVLLKNEVERLVEVSEQARVNLLDQLDDIEREYKDSQEWFISREVQDVRVGVVGTERSQKTALVSLFVEGVLEIEGDEKDGRSKSKITVDGKCKLLLIREETGYPSKQLCQWADVVLMTFSYKDVESLTQVAEFYRTFREMRENPNVPVLLVGIKGGSPSQDNPQAHMVKDGQVHKTQEMMDKCPFFDVALNQQHVYSLFAHACRLALTSSYFATTSCPIIFPSSPSQSSLSGGATHMKFTAMPPPSPSHGKRTHRKKPGFSFGGTKASYSVKSPLTPLSESFGSGRHIPIKEGSINKKSTGGLRPEWKKKYLVLSRSELTYYPSLNDYMTMTHGKALNLQLISVKIPGSRSLGFSRSTTAPPNNSNPTTADSYSQPSAEATQPGSDMERSNSVSPTPYESSVDYSATAAPGKVSGTSPNMRHRETHSPVSPVEFSPPDSTDESGRLNLQFESLMLADRGHNRNSSMDEITLQQLRTGGMAYHQPEEATDRAATLSRLQGKKMKERPGKGGYLSVLQPGSEELLSDGITGSTESLGKPEKKRKGDKDRNSWMESTVVGGAKDKKGKGHKRQRSWAGNKVLDAQEQPEPIPEACEFQILSLDGKVWAFETSTTEEMLSWVRTVEDQIKKILSESISHKRVNSVNDIEKKEMFTMEGNEFCADCNSPNPEWGSVNYGCLLCIECSGVHRKLGSHISRVRSLSLDEWSPELIAVMLSIGNKNSKSIFEGKKPRNKPIYSSQREEREKYIRAKYIDKEFLLDLPESDQTISEQLLDAVRSNSDSVVECLHLLAHSTPEDLNRLHDAADGCSLLHLACSLGRTVILQLLIWHGADINLLDMEKHSPLFYARSAGHQDCVNILLANNCNDNQSPGSSDTGSIEVLQAPVM